METGRWSSKGVPLDFSTVNQRTDAATAYLAWAANRQLRPTFSVPMISSVRVVDSGSSSGRTFSATRVRAGRIRAPQNKAIRRYTMIPSAIEIRDWLGWVRQHRGYVKYLACKFILETGPRRGECVGGLEQDLPTREEIAMLTERGQFMAPMELRETKGGRPRTIEVPLALVSELRQWADTKRLTLSYAFTKRTGLPAPSRLFISDRSGFEGTPVSAQTLYESFTANRPVPNWSPHKGRHTFACCYMLHAMEYEARIAGSSLGTMPSGWIVERGSWWMATLRRQLGHVHEETTHLYLRWLMTAVQVAAGAASWHAFLNGE